MGQGFDTAKGGRARIARLVALTGLLLLSACGHLGDGPGPEAGDIRLRFEEQPAPDVFLIEAEAQREKPGGAAGLWASVQGLQRPERAEAVNLATGRTVDLALYSAGKDGSAIHLSDEAADALGIAGEPVKVRITALRQQPVIDTKEGAGFNWR